MARFRLPCLLAALLIGLSAPSWAQTEINLEGPQDPYNYHVAHYALNITPNIAEHSIAGEVVMEAYPQKPMDRFVFDLDNALSIDNITVDGAKVPANQIARMGKRASFPIPGWEVAPTGHVSVAIKYHGVPKESIKPPWDGGFVWSADANKKPWVGVACQGIGASIWWPCKDTIADEPDSMHITCTVPSSLFCKANGRLLEKKTEGKNTRFRYGVANRINLYDVTINIGDYVELTAPYTSIDKSQNTLRYYVLSGNATKAAEHFRQVVPMLKCYEAAFGAYPFWNDGFALVEAPYWGMEHQSAVAYGNKFKNLPEGFDFIIAHESAHEWWGNSLTVADQRDEWVQEGFATYAETMLLECLKGKTAATRYLNKQRNDIVSKVPIIGDRPKSPLTQDNDAYYKGAWLLQTLRTQMGDSTFRACLLELATSFKKHFVATADVQAIFSRHSVYPLDGVFRQYLESAFIPTIEVTRINNDYTLNWVADFPDFELTVPVNIYTENAASTRLIHIPPGGYTLNLPKGARLDPNIGIDGSLVNSVPMNDDEPDGH